MSYPYLPVNPCCTDVVLNSPCGCTSTINNIGCGSNDPCSTHTVLSSNVIYNGPILPCIIAEPCDTLNVILQKIDQIICTLLGQISTLQTQVNNITTEILIINNDITNIYNTLDVCCVTTTTTSTTMHPCEQFSLNNTGEDPIGIIITNCTTNLQEAIVLLPGDTNICVVTDSPLTVPGTVIVTPNGPCGTSTTTSTSSSTTTTTTTVLYPCECLTFNNRDVDTHIITYIDCNNDPSGSIEIFPYEVIKVCGSQGFASDPLVLITVGEDCRSSRCVVLPTTTSTSSSTTTTTTTISSMCFTFGSNLCENAPNGTQIFATPSGTYGGKVYYEFDVCGNHQVIWFSTIDSLWHLSTILGTPEVCDFTLDNSENDYPISNNTTQLWNNPSDGCYLYLIESSLGSCSDYKMCFNLQYTLDGIVYNFFNSVAPIETPFDTLDHPTYSYNIITAGSVSHTVNFVYDSSGSNTWIARIDSVIIGTLASTNIYPSGTWIPNPSNPLSFIVSATLGGSCIPPI